MLFKNWPTVILSIFICITPFLSTYSSGGHGATTIAETGPKPTIEQVNSEIMRIFPKLERDGQMANCKKCHETVFKKFASSVHGSSKLLKGLPQTAFCITCHESNHRFNTNEELNEGRYKLNMVAKFDTCKKCHSNSTIVRGMGLPPQVATEFETSMHYRKMALGHKGAPSCYDCHGNHSILSMSNPASPKNSPEARTKMCGKCHTGSNPNFGDSFDHTPISWGDKPIQFFVLTMFKILTLGTFVGLSLYMLLDIIAIIRQKFIWKDQFVGHTHKSHPKGSIVRFNGPIRLQHFLMLASVLTLVVTGWPLFVPESEVSRTWSEMLGGTNALGIIHRVAGIVMIGDFIFHLVYILYKLKQTKNILAFPMLPTPKDIFDVVHVLMFFFGIKKERPNYAEYTFFEKFDYWAVFWGVAMMGVSGLILMMPTVVTAYLPGVVINVSEIIHADESLLAGVVLIIWHFWNVHFKPGIFPMNWVWFTGRMSKHHYEEEHAAHVEELKKTGKWNDHDDIE